ncbi:hypothetical protein KKE26_02445 [bacterium]|nr:hypothetical protein [bacterium]MBU1752751.1 hypothetical protein [bacterium]
MKTFTQALEKHKPCPFYKEGACCRACYMGPCRITDKAKEGVCGATDSTISARNLGRMAAAGASSLSTAAISMLNSQQKGNWFSSQEEKGLDLSKILPAERVTLLNRLHLTPRNIQREIVELLHRVSIGVDQECEHILLQTLRMSLGGVLSSALLPDDKGSATVDIDTAMLSSEKPTVILFGNVQLSSDKINIVRVDSLLKLEALLTSGLVDVVFCDAIPASVKYMGECYHTTCVSDSSGIVAKAIGNQSKRTQTLNFKGAIKQPKLSARILKNAIMESNIRGIVWLSGCINPCLSDEREKIVRELVANDVLVIVTGCSINQLMDTNLLHQPVAPTGEFLREFCEKANIPPVIYLGTCLKEGAVIRLLNEICGAAAIGDLSSLPVGLVLPSWRSERNISLVLAAIACGISVRVNSHLPINSEVRGFLGNKCSEIVLGHLLKDDASILEYINRKRERLSLSSSLNTYVPEATNMQEDYLDTAAAAAFSIYKELGHGLSVDVYKNALVVELKHMGLQTSFIKVPITYLGSTISECEELLVEDDGIIIIGNAAVKNRLKTALTGAKKEKGLWIVFDKEMLRIGCVELAKGSAARGA